LAIALRTLAMAFSVTRMPFAVGVVGSVASVAASRLPGHRQAMIHHGLT